MNKPLKHLPKAAVAVIAAIGLSACASDVTQSRVQSDVSATFGHVYGSTQQLIGKPGSASWVSSSCEHTGGVKKNIGSGGWVCMIKYTKTGSSGPTTDKYSVSVDNTDCYVATNGQLAQTPNITSAKGTQIVNPLYQFDGCIDPYSG